MGHSGPHRPCRPGPTPIHAPFTYSLYAPSSFAFSCSPFALVCGLPVATAYAARTGPVTRLLLLRMSTKCALLLLCQMGEEVRDAPHTPVTNVAGADQALVGQADAENCCTLTVYAVEADSGAASPVEL